jgi:hypothetical protein
MSTQEARCERTNNGITECERLTLDARRRVLGPEHPVILVTATNLGNERLDRNQLGDVERLLSETLAVQRKILSRGHSNLAATLGGLGLSLTRSGQPRKAEPLLSEALGIRRQTLATADRRIRLAESAQGECLAAQRRFVEAERLLVGSVEQLVATPGTAPIRRRQAIGRTIALFHSWEKPAEADAWRAKLLDVNFPTFPFNHSP